MPLLYPFIVLDMVLLLHIYVRCNLKIEKHGWCEHLARVVRRLSTIRVVG